MFEFYVGFLALFIPVLLPDEAELHIRRSGKVKSKGLCILEKN